MATSKLVDALFITRRKRLRLVFDGSLVGLVAGVTISFYRFCLSHAESLLRMVTSELAAHGMMYGLWVLALIAMCLVVGWLMLVEPYTQGSGIPQLEAEVAGRINMPWQRVLPIKFVEGTIVALAGLSLGREGPSVLLGGMAGKSVSRALGRGRANERLLTTCGAAAGMSAAFHAPLTGVLFAIEEIHREFSATLVISVMASSVVSDLISSHVLGTQPLIHFVIFHTLPQSAYLAVLGLGIFCGLVGALHNRGMFLLQERVFGKLDGRQPFIRLAVPFALAGVVAILWPDLMCGGDAIIERMLEVHTQPASVLLALLIGKYIYTSICFGSGAPGGTLLPLVVMGSLVGGLYGYAVMELGIGAHFLSSFVVLGIAGMFASSIQAPVTAVVLVFELTGSLEALLATSMVSIVAYVVSTLTNTDSFYEHLYKRLMGDEIVRTAERNSHRHKEVHTYVVGPGAAVEGRTVKEVPWPSNALVITVTHDGQEMIARGDTRIEALDELCVVIDGKRLDETNKQLRSLLIAS